jgi:hypothetical protein
VTTTPKKTLAFDAATAQWYYPEDGRPTPTLVACAFCGHLSARHRQEQSGDSYTCQRPECGKSHYFSIGD